MRSPECGRSRRALPRAAPPRKAAGDGPPVRRPSRSRLRSGMIGARQAKRPAGAGDGSRGVHRAAEPMARRSRPQSRRGGAAADHRPLRAAGRGEDHPDARGSAKDARGTAAGPSASRSMTSICHTPSSARWRGAIPDNRFLQHRGYPGTHDVDLGVRVLTALKSLEAGLEPGGSGLRPLRLRRRRRSATGQAAGGASTARSTSSCCEGWMLGFTPVAAARVADPGLRAINDLLRGYARWHALLDGFIWLEPEDHLLRARVAGGGGGAGDRRRQGGDDPGAVPGLRRSLPPGICDLYARPAPRGRRPGARTCT